MEQNSVKQRTSISAGLVVYELLNVSEITREVSKVFPVFTETAELPYICYRRTGLSPEFMKKSVKDMAQFEISIYGKTYEEAVNLAEKVRNALDGMSGEAECGLLLSRCSLIDASDDWVDDSFIQKLNFILEI